MSSRNATLLSAVVLIAAGCDRNLEPEGATASERNALSAPPQQDAGTHKHTLQQAAALCLQKSGKSQQAQSDGDGDGLADSCDPCPFDRLNDADGDEQCGSLAQSRLLLPQLPPADPNDNLLLRASYQLPADGRLLMVSEADYLAALEALPERQRSSTDLTALDVAYASGERANDPWTAGVIALELNDRSTVTGSVFLVARDATQAPDGEVLVTSYFLAALPLTVNANWSATAMSFAQVPNRDKGTGRCCGAPQTCATDSTPRPPVCPPTGRCGSTTYTTGVTASGVPTQVRAVAYNQGLEIESFCFPKLDPLCSQATPMCDSQGGVDHSRTWQAVLPGTSGGGNCSSGTPDRQVSGRLVPESCTFVRGGSWSATSSGISTGGGNSLPECDGQCFGCGTGEAFSTPQRLSQCALMRFTAGNGVCEYDPRQRLADQALLRIEAGVDPGQSGERCVAAPRIQSGTAVWQCTVCNAAGCHHTLKPSPINPIANPAASCSAGAQTSCGNVSPTDPTAGSLATGGATPTGTALAQLLTTLAATSDQAPPAGPWHTTTPLPPNDGRFYSASGDGSPSKLARFSAAMVEDPILLSDGSLQLDHADLSFPGPVRALEFRRSYNSRSRGRSELGSNWSHNWDVRLVPLNDSNRPDWVDPFCAGSPFQTTCVMLHTGDTQRLFSRDPTSGLFVPQAGVTSTLAQMEAGKWMLRSADGHVWTFDADGLLERDEDRFGNAFTVAWEPNAWGRVSDAICPKEPTRLDSSGNYVVTFGPENRYDSGRSECGLLGGLTGRRKPLLFGSNAPSALAISVPTSTNSEAVQQALALLVEVQTGSPRRVGSSSPWGARFKRVRAVTDSVGRTLNFQYFPDTDRRAIQPGLYHAGLLMSVSGPAGARIEFGYGAPTGHPPHLNEAFLTSATRVDFATVSRMTVS